MNELTEETDVSDCFNLVDSWNNGGYSSPIDPLLTDLDSLSSSSSISPKKQLNLSLTDNDSGLTSKLSSISLDDEMFLTPSHTRLPVFDGMFNSHSATLLEVGSYL